jgi:hypothetical protein
VLAQRSPGLPGGRLTAGSEIGAAEGNASVPEDWIGQSVELVFISGAQPGVHRRHPPGDQRQGHGPVVEYPRLAPSAVPFLSVERRYPALPEAGRVKGNQMSLSPPQRRVLEKWMH